MTDLISREAAIETIEANKPPRCSDFDEDCEGIEDKLKCYLYDPYKGYCPFLSKGSEG